MIKMYSHKPFTKVFLTSHVVLYCMKRICISVAWLSSSLRHIAHTHNLTLQWSFETSGGGNIATDSPLLPSTKYKTTRLTVINSHCLAASPAPLKNGVPQVSVLAPLLFNIYISWLASHRLQKACISWRSSNHACWWRLAGSGRVLCKRMVTACEYLQTWKLKFSTTKAVSVAFHLNNKAAKRELKVNFNNETLPFCPNALE